MAEGINDELRPVLRMTAPGSEILDLAAIRPPPRLGRSWLLLFGALPIDVDDPSSRGCVAPEGC